AKEGEKPKSCFECHKEAESEVNGEKVPALGTTKKDVIFHANCLDCHKAKKKDGNDKAPTKCKGCHAKK
ncbi:cytochrome c3 family protein, partial [Thermodesulfobacteriota bacterium]